MVSILSVPGESLIEKVTPERRSVRGERVGHMKNGGKSVPGSGNSQCEDPEVQMCLNCWRSSGEASMHGEQ